MFLLPNCIFYIPQGTSPLTFAHKCSFFLYVSICTPPRDRQLQVLKYSFYFKHEYTILLKFRSSSYCLNYILLCQLYLLSLSFLHQGLADYEHITQATILSPTDQHILLFSIFHKHFVLQNLLFHYLALLGGCYLTLYLTPGLWEWVFKWKRQLCGMKISSLL